jgi:hypothetical protein
MDDDKKNEFKTRLNRIHEDALQTVEQPQGRMSVFWTKIILWGIAALLILCLFINNLHETSGEASANRRERVEFRPTVLSVTNIMNGETLRYPVALLCGTTDDYGDVSVFNDNNLRPSGQNSAPIMEGRFKILVQLSPGVNQIRLSSQNINTALTLNYKPLTTPYKVVFIYLVPDAQHVGEDSVPWPDHQDYSDNLSTAAKLLQTFMAERMNDAGAGRKTFNLEYDSEGNVLIHTMSYPASGEAMQKAVETKLGDIVDMVEQRVNYRFPSDRNQVVLFTSFENQEARGLTSYPIAIVGSSDISQWPKSLHEIRLAATDWNAVMHLSNIGPVMHELGHCFGCDHSSDQFSIMGVHWVSDQAPSITDGAYDFNRLFTVTDPAMRSSRKGAVYQDKEISHWEPYLACHLYYHRWLQPDAREFHDNRSITIRLNRSTQEYIIKSPYGIGAVQFYGPPLSKREFAPPAKTHYVFFKTNAPTKLQYKRADIHTKLDTTERIGIIVTDIEGNVQQYKEEE